MLAFEDLHWADPATLRAVRIMGRALPRLPMVLLVTLRLHPARPELARVVEELVSHGATRLTLRPLSELAVTTLAAAVAGAPPGELLSQQLSGAAGNPLFVIELIKALRDQGSLMVRQGRADVADRSSPSTLPMTILRRMSLLPASTMNLLTLAAVLGREFSVAELAGITGRSAVSLLPDLDAALRAGLLVESPGGLAFRHELMREAIYHDLAPPLRQGIHREIAQALTAAGVPAVRLADHLFLADRLGDARTVLQLGRQLGEERGNVMWLPLHHAVLAVHHFGTGELTDAMAEVEAGLALADEVGIRLHASLLHGVAAWVALARGDITGGQARLDDAVVEFTASVTQNWQLTAAAEGIRTAGARWPLEWGLYIQALLCEAQGQTDQARALLEDAWELAAPLRFLLSYRFLAPDLVRLALAAGDRDRAAAVAGEVAQGAQRSGMASATGAALRCQGLLDDDPMALLAAVDTYRQLPQTLELALSCEDASACLIRTGRGEQAVPLLGEALTFYSRTGAHRGAARTEAALRALGVRRRRPAQIRRSTVGWDSLTTSELRVARLAGEGLTNPQIGDRLFISRRTVATHLANVFRKLGINNRVQLAAEISHRQSVSKSSVSRVPAEAPRRINHS